MSAKNSRHEHHNRKKLTHATESDRRWHRKDLLLSILLVVLVGLLWQYFS